MGQAMLPVLAVALLLPFVAQGYRDDGMFKAARGSGFEGTYHTAANRLFGFKSGGHVELMMTCSGPTGALGLAAVNEKEYNDLDDSSSSICSSTESRVSVFFSLANRTVTPLLPGTTQYYLKEPFGGRGRQKFYRFLLSECPPAGGGSAAPPAKCTYEILTLNPGGEHLSRDEVALPDIYLGYGVLWGALLAVWLLDWVHYNEFSNPLHRFILLPAALKMATIILEYQTWQNLHETGKGDARLEYGRSLCLYLENAFFFALIMLLSEAWCIINRRIEPSEATIIAILPTLFFITTCCMRWVHRYFLGLSIILVIIMVVYVVRHCGFNILFLMRRWNDIQSAFHFEDRAQVSPQAYASPLLAKIHAMRAVRAAFIFYAVSWAILGIASGFLDEYSWVEALVLELVESIFYVWILWTFRLRDFNRFYPADERRRTREEVEVAVFESSRKKPMALLVPVDEDLFQEFVDVELKRTRHRSRSAASPEDGFDDGLEEVELEDVEVHGAPQPVEHVRQHAV